MKLDIEFLAEQLGKFPGANGFSWSELRPQKCHDLVVDLVGTAGPRLCRH